MPLHMLYMCGINSMCTSFSPGRPGRPCTSRSSTRSGRPSGPATCPPGPRCPRCAGSRGTRAYNDLAAAGLIGNQAGRGSFVLPQDEDETRARLLARLDAQLDDAVATARLAGLDLSDLHERSTQRWNALNTE